MSDYYPPEHRDKLLEVLRRVGLDKKAYERFSSEVKCSRDTFYRWKNVLIRELAERELERVDNPAPGVSGPAIALIDKDEELKRRRKLFHYYKGTIDVLLRTGENLMHSGQHEEARAEQERAREKLEKFREVDPEGASAIEKEFRDRLHPSD